MVVLERQHPDLKMDEVAIGVTEYMNEEAAKEGGEDKGPNATEEATSPPPPALIDVAKASTPLGATGETPPAPLPDNPAKAALLTNPPSSSMHHKFLW